MNTKDTARHLTNIYRTVTTILKYLLRFLTKTEFIPPLHTQNDKAAGYHYLPADVVRRNINLYTNAIRHILQQGAIDPRLGKGARLL